jgi:2-polyprenyl-3-methyl-5-hydroxy-6-metoxy-1,4-benzoquinol methylase
MSTAKTPGWPRSALARVLRTTAGRLVPEEAAAPAPPPVAPAVPDTKPEVDSGTGMDASGVHTRAQAVYERLRRHPEVTDDESRLLELIDYYGWEIGHKAWACKRWFYRDDEALGRYLEVLRLSYWQFAIMHQYALLNRFDPQRPDLFWVYDEVVRRVSELGEADDLAVLDFGCGTGQIGLGFALDGYSVISAEVEPELVTFARYLFESRGLVPEMYESTNDRDYYDSGGAGKRFGCVVEWSVFEHIYDIIECAESITRGLVPGGVFVTTTLAKHWTPELREHYARDAGDTEISDQLFSADLDEYVAENFDVVSSPDSIAKLLIQR